MRSNAKKNPKRILSLTQPSPMPPSRSSTRNTRHGLPSFKCARYLQSEGPLLGTHSSLPRDMGSLALAFLSFFLKTHHVIPGP